MDQEETDFPVATRFQDDEENGEDQQQSPTAEQNERPPSEQDDDEESGEDIMKDGGNLIGSDGEADSSEEDEEDDPEEAKRIAEGFIVEDEGDDDDESSNEDSQRRKRRARRKKRRQLEEAENEQLDEDDLDLVAENTGRKRKDRRLKRFRRASVSPPATAAPAMEKPRDLEHMFDDDDDEPIAPRRLTRDDEFDEDDEDDLPSAGHALRTAAEHKSSRDVDPLNYEDEMEDFIDDDEESDMDEDLSEGEREERREERRRQRKAELQERRAKSGGGFDPGRAGIDAEAWAELNDVFGDGSDYAFALKLDDEDDDEDVEQDVTEEKRKRAEIKDIFEPAAIQARMMTDEDDRIKRADFPERFQTLLPGDEGLQLLERVLTAEELDECTRWVSRRFSYRSNKTFLNDADELAAYREQWFRCVRSMVELIINQRREAMYLCTHRVDDYELRVNDQIVDLLQRRDFSALVAACLKFKTLLARRDSLRATFAKLSTAEFAPTDEEQIIFEQMIQRSESTDEVADVAEWLVMRYGQRMRDAQAHDESSFKRPTVISKYEQLKATPVSAFANRFGLTSLQLAENISGQTRVHFTEDENSTPLSLADEYVNATSGVTSAKVVLDSARSILAQEIGKDPALKREARRLLRESGIISVTPTERGHQRIDEENPYYNFKFLVDKPVMEFTVVVAGERLPAPAQYLMILKAEEELLVHVHVSVLQMDASAFESRLMENFASEGFSETSRLWNEERRKIIRQALDEHLYPSAKLWVREWLREECWEFIGRASEVALTKRIDVQPYHSVSMQARQLNKQSGSGAGYYDSDDDEEEASNTFNIPSVLSVSHGAGDPRRDQIETIFLDSSGRFREHVSFETISKPPPNSEEALDETKAHPSREFKQLLASRRPDVIVVSGFSPRTVTLRQQIQELVSEAVSDIIQDNEIETEQQDTAQIDVIHCSDDVARMYQHSERAKEEFPALSSLARYCVGLARYVQSPLQEFVALTNEDLLALRYDPYQHLIPKERLLHFLERSLIAVVNTVCVDINRASIDAYYANLLRYVSGLGPRKADALLRAVVTQLGGNVVNRDALLIGASDSEMLNRNMEILPSHVWHNACSFLVIRSPSMRNSVGKIRMQGRSDALDRTRIHPESYEYARFIAFDALRKTEEDREEGQHPSLWCEELMHDDSRRSKVQDIDMADYERNLWAEMIQRGQKRERKLGLLEFIARELVEPLQELRRTFILPSTDEILTMFTGETRATFDTQRLVNVQVFRIFRDYISVRLESGIEGTIHAEYLRPENVDHTSRYPPTPRDLVKVGQTLKAQIIDIDAENLRAELTARPDHIEMAKATDQERRKVPVDARYFDREQAIEEHNQAEIIRQKKRNATRGTRIIRHPDFHNFKAGQAEEALTSMPRGAAIVRPSSKGDDHLAITWKVDEGVFQHIDVLELDKENEHEIGRILRIGNVGGSSYSDLDELLVNHIAPMARMVDMLMTSEKYHGSDEELQRFLTNFSLANPTRSQYGFAIDKKRPGLFILGFKANRDAPVQRWPIRVLPGRFKLNEAELPDVVSLCNAFKTQYTTRAMRAGGRTPGPGIGGMTPGFRAGASYGGASATPNPYGARPPPPGAPPVRPGPPPARPPQFSGYDARSSGPPPPRPPPSNRFAPMETNGYRNGW